MARRKLTDEDIDKIKEIYETDPVPTLEEIGKQLGVTGVYVNQISRPGPVHRQGCEDAGTPHWADGVEAVRHGGVRDPGRRRLR